LKKENVSGVVGDTVNNINKKEVIVLVTFANRKMGSNADMADQKPSFSQLLGNGMAQYMTAYLE